MSSRYSEDEEDVATIIASLVALIFVAILAIVIPSYSLKVQVEPANVGGSICVAIYPEGSAEESKSECVKEEKEGDTSITFSGLEPGKYQVRIEEVGSSGEGKPSIPSVRWETVEITEEGETTIRVSMTPEETDGGE